MMQPITRGHRMRDPFIPTPEREEKPVVEELVAPSHIEDVRPIHLQKAAPLLKPHYNEVYGSLRAEGGWRYIIDGYAKGTITTSGGVQVSSLVTLVSNTFIRLSQWPDAIQFYLCIQFFGIVPQTIPAVGGAIECFFSDQAGNLVPLGEFSSSSGGNITRDNLIPGPITDLGNTAIGNLLVTLSPGNGSGVTYNYSLSFGYAYLLPSTRRYESEHMHHDKH